MKTEKEEEEYKVKMEELKNFLFLVNVYTSEFYAGFKLSEVISKLDDEILVYEYNKELNIEDLKPLCGFIKKDEDIKENKYARAYAAAKYFNTSETGNKQVDKYILQMQQKYDKII